MDKYRIKFTRDYFDADGNFTIEGIVRVNWLEPPGEVP